MKIIKSLSTHKHRCIIIRPNRPERHHFSHLGLLTAKTFGTFCFSRLFNPIIFAALCIVRVRATKMLHQNQTEKGGGRSTKTKTKTRTKKKKKGTELCTFRKNMSFLSLRPGPKFVLIKLLCFMRGHESSPVGTSAATSKGTDDQLFAQVVITKLVCLPAIKTTD